VGLILFLASIDCNLEETKCSVEKYTKLKKLSYILLIMGGGIFVVAAILCCVLDCAEPGNIDYTVAGTTFSVGENI